VESKTAGSAPVVGSCCRQQFHKQRHTIPSDKQVNEAVGRTRFHPKACRGQPIRQKAHSMFASRLRWPSSLHGGNSRDHLQTGLLASRMGRHVICGGT
jgi:hypothetical protein